MFRLGLAARRTFATAAKPGTGAAAGAAPASPSTRLRKKAPLDLKLFIQRSRVIGLYRTIVRGSRQISDPTTRKETLKFARAEFERNKNETDAERVRYLLSTGKSEWENAERYFEGM
ncbi:complex 1 lyr protein [Ophiostoma piceae UAMH 11346]|uniref:LYR motif-containing protein 2 n=1 Tax=Ophiostoma piceae (strain UAMH 11346) TaxID=1262450 RepID=S3BT78_OPHP1|nr:complex 1 lyr protein [Ophiostoma piceae UAMH 11346]